MPNLKNFLHMEKWKKMKKSDWLLFALAGILLLVIAMPTGNREEDTGDGQNPEAVMENVSKKEDEAKEYIDVLEKKLEQTLKKMEGVGNVIVMITAEDNGENVVEKDSNRNTVTTTEEDSGGGSRSVMESSVSSSTVYAEEGSGKYPYVQKELLPVIKGVVVVAEGGGDTHVKTEITEAVQALFPVEAHRIKVVAMNRK